MVGVLVIVIGIGLIVIALADLVNTLVTTSTSNWRWWPSTAGTDAAGDVDRAAGARFRADLVGRRRDRREMIGYLRSLYGAYSAREQKLMTLDDGSDDRITPTSLVLAWSPDADTDVVCSGRTESYWFLRRSIAPFEELTCDVDLSDYEHFAIDPVSREVDDSPMFLDLYQRMEEHGFELLPLEEAAQRSLLFRNRFAPQLEYLIDELLCPRGFWAPDLGLDLTDDLSVRTDVNEF